MNSVRIWLLNAEGQPVEAELFDKISNAHLADWYQHWRAEMGRIVQGMAERGIPMDEWPQDCHWEWNAKMAEYGKLLNYKSYGITCEGHVQAMMLTSSYHKKKKARLPNQAGKDLVYVDYIATAPWNRRSLNSTPSFKGMGSILLGCAVEDSFDQEFKGRIGLHSLPQAADFYRKCGMIDLGMDPEYDKLRYFEMSENEANRFRQRENS